MNIGSGKIPSKNVSLGMFSAGSEFETITYCLGRISDRQTWTPKESAAALKQLQQVARLGGNAFEE